MNIKETAEVSRNSELPEGYKQGVPRVSNVVSFVFPFEGTDGEKRYKSWLRRVGVIEKDYLETAQTIGTYIHQCMEDYINGDVVILAEYNETVSNTIQQGFAYIDELKEQYEEEWTFVAEPVLLDHENRFQGSSDLVLIHKKEKKVKVIDWKSFGIAKSFFSLPNKYKKPYDKIKKGRLQFSLYGETYKQKGYKVDELILVYLHEDQAFPYTLEQINSDGLNEILDNYNASVNSLQGTVDSEPAADTSVIYNPTTKMYEIEILEPTVQYGNVKIKAQINNLEDDEKKTIDNLIKKAKYIANEMKKPNGN